MTNQNNIGSSFDSFLNDQGILKVCEERAEIEILVDQIKAAMEERNINITQMAELMGTSRAQVNRLLDATAESNINLQTLRKAANAVGRRLSLTLEEPLQESA
ncbi:MULTISPECIES: helix-turn-helix domain-containing protein [Pseudovibrio]|uniref:Helix-turn-helix transcriptional regulator n=1 Tax=Pseudovibrio brasiliensis TaxID=1898042 RepID=A0ABX8ALS9_9HYPH|nr:helix-turn-helix transcriptional regulator [Pseudovibrio brasiliensis]QUS55632.1 helix-turn-helix transcriptional regulator [Pseudovibrio brasiliensis]